MKKTLVFLFLSAAFLRVSAQDTTFPYNAGGFGHFFTGPTFFQPGSLRDYMEKPSVLNTSLPVRAGVISGGEGFGLLGRFLLGGGGFGQTMLRHTTDSARLNMSFGGGYFKFGYVICYRKGSFGYAFGAIGWGAVNVHLENISDETPIHFNRRVPLQPGSKRDYALPYNFYDFGLSYKKLFKKYESDGGGFMVGLDLGCMLTLPTGDWQAGDEVVSGPPLPTSSLNPYLRITIGGGGFSTGE